MKNEQQSLLDSYAQGIIDATREFEKDAEFQAWMENPKFRAKLAAALGDKIKQVRGENPTDA